MKGNPVPKESKGMHFPTTRMVLSYYRQRPGQIINYHDAAADLAIPENRVNAALSRTTIKYPQYGIRREGSGEYVFRPELELNDAPELTSNPGPEPDEHNMYEEVGRTSDGAIVIRDLNGFLWKIGDLL